jgi:hypothetical protein
MQTQNTNRPPSHRAIVICTNKRGVFFGYIPEDGPTNEEIHSGKLFTMARPRMCVFWSRTVGGVLGLAATGPDSECRVGPAPGSITLGGDTTKPHDCVLDVTDEAAEAWESAPWLK